MTGWIWCLNRACFTGITAGRGWCWVSGISGRSDPRNFTGSWTLDCFSAQSKSTRLDHLIERCTTDTVYKYDTGCPIKFFSMGLVGERVLGAAVLVLNSDLIT